MEVMEPSARAAVDNDATRAHAHADDPRWQLAQRIASSDGLSRSRLLQEFLLYVVDRELASRDDEITEQQIGVLVFGRSEGYDSNEDNIVRGYARNLRKRVEEYFAGEGSNEHLRLTIPRGGYRPAFFEHEVIAPTPEPVTENAATVTTESEESAGSEPQTNTPRRLLLSRQLTALRIMLTRRPLLAIALGTLIGAAATFAILRMPPLSHTEQLSHTLWTELFNHDHDTYIVPSDVGLVIMQGLMPRPIPLADYVNGRYRVNANQNAMPGGQRLFVLGGRRFTNVVDLDFISHVMQRKEIVPERAMVRYARDLRMDDLRTGNAILIGANESNPWLELFLTQAPIRFCFYCTPDPKLVIYNSHPRSGERQYYVNSGDGDTFGLIAYVPNLSSTGHILVVAGLNTAGTQAATSFLLDPRLMKQVLQDARNSNGTLQPFELIVSASNVATNAATPHAVLEHIGLDK